MNINKFNMKNDQWGLGPIPNPQSPISNPQSPIILIILFLLYIILFKYL